MLDSITFLPQPAEDLLRRAQAHARFLRAARLVVIRLRASHRLKYFQLYGREKAERELASSERNRKQRLADLERQFVKCNLDPLLLSDDDALGIYSEEDESDGDYPLSNKGPSSPSSEITSKKVSDNVSLDTSTVKRGDSERNKKDDHPLVIPVIEPKICDPIPSAGSAVSMMTKLTLTASPVHRKVREQTDLDVSPWIWREQLMEQPLESTKLGYEQGLLEAREVQGCHPLWDIEDVPLHDLLVACEEEARKEEEENARREAEAAAAQAEAQAQAQAQEAAEMKQKSKLKSSKSKGKRSDNSSRSMSVFSHEEKESVKRKPYTQTNENEVTQSTPAPAGTLHASSSATPGRYLNDTQQESASPICVRLDAEETNSDSVQTNQKA